MKVYRTEKEISVNSPYNPDLPSRAKKLGGKWNSSQKVWVFDIRDEEQVAKLYRNIYGEWDNDGAVPADAVTVRVTVHESFGVYRSGIFFAGRQVASATGRDSGARLGGGVIVLKGGFGSDGSVKNWRTLAEAGTIFEIKDVPLCKVKEEQEKTGSKWWSEIEILGDVDRAALRAEKDTLLARLGEIEKLLSA